MHINKINIAIVGYGHIGKRHHVVISENENTNVVAIIDIDKTQQQQANNIPFFTTIEEAIAANITIDMAAICTPNYLHATNAIACLQHNMHVLVEKPMCTTTQDANAMIAAATIANKQIFVVKQNRYNPPVQQVKQCLLKNSLGKIYSIHVTCFWNRNDAYYNSDWRGNKMKDGGILFTQFSHFIDIVYYLFGNLTPIHTILQNCAHPKIEIEDTCIATLQTKENALVSITASNNTFLQNMEGAITIIAEKGTIKIGGQYLNTIEYQQIENIQLPAINILNKANNYGHYQGSMSNHDKVYENVVNTLNGIEQIMTNATEGKEVVQIIEAIYAIK